MVLSGLLAGCSSWRPVRAGEQWTLYAREGEALDPRAFERVLAPAVQAVEQALGPFERRVRVHLWDSDAGDVGGAPQQDDLLAEVPGFGPARVRGFHLRASGPFQWATPSGVFLGVPDAGVAVHELVHARLCERGPEPPLWLEEGLATLLGDGALYAGRWVRDGLACWPLRELRREPVGDEELVRLLALDASDDYGARENLLVHFVGWALVFDLWRAEPHRSWREWLATFEAAEDPLAEARRRLARTLATETERAWLERLGAADTGVRFAAARGLWKLRSSGAVVALLDRLRVEPDAEVRAALAVNALLGAGRSDVDVGLWERLRREALPVLREARVPDPLEREALARWHAALRGEDPEAGSAALDDLARLWDE